MKRAVSILGAIALMFSLSGCKDSNRTSCEERGGVVDSATKTGVGTGVNSRGGVSTVTTVSTTYYCIIDGKVVDIW